MKNVSIVIPIYNVEKYLDKCLSSVANQTYKDFEVILVDDGSTDSCRDICMKWIDKDSRFVYFYKENGGLGSARNYGAKKTEGLWLTFLDSDDWWELEYLEEMMNKTKHTNADVIYCDAYVCVQDTEKKVANVRSMFKYICADIRDRIALGINASVWGAIYRKKIWDEADIKFPRIIYEDTAIYGVLVHYFNLYDVVEKPLYNYRKRSGSIMDANKYEYGKMIAALDYLLKFARTRKLFDNYKTEYFELCRSQLYPRWKNHQTDKETVKQAMLEFYKRNFPFHYKIGRIMSLGSQMSAKVYEGLIPFPNVERDVYSFTSIVSITSQPPNNDINLIYCGNNEYRIRMIQKDIRKTWLNNLSGCKYVILDLLNESNNLISLGNLLFTASEAVDSECKIPDNAKISDRDLLTPSKWRDSCKKLFEILYRNNTKIILLELYLCEEYGNYTKRNKYNDTDNIRHINKKLESYYAYIKSNYDTISISLEGKYQYTDKEYKFGCYPWYFNDCAIYTLRKEARKILYDEIFYKDAEAI